MGEEEEMKANTGGDFVCVFVSSPCDTSCEMGSSTERGGTFRDSQAESSSLPPMNGDTAFTPRERERERRAKAPALLTAKSQ